MKTYTFKCIFCLFNLLISKNLFSQSASGLIGGIQTNWVRVQTNSVSVNTKKSYGGTFGLFKEYEVGENFYLRPNINLTIKNLDFDTDAFSDNVSLLYGSVDISIPINYKIDVNYNKFYFGTGPNILVGVSGKFSDGTKLTFGGDYEDLKPIVLSWNLTAGFEFTDKNNFIQLSYLPGISNVSNNGQGIKTSINTINFSIGHFFSR